jgi:NitT/TauT family transport system permease protein
MPSNPAPLADTDPVATEAPHIHAALTRTSTGNEDLRELESGLDSLQSDAARKNRIDWSFWC